MARRTHGTARESRDRRIHGDLISNKGNVAAHQETGIKGRGGEGRARSSREGELRTVLYAKYQTELKAGHREKCKAWDRDPDQNTSETSWSWAGPTSRTQQQS